MAKQQKSKKRFSGKKRTGNSPRLKSDSKHLPSFFYNTKMSCWIILLFSLILYANTFSHQYTQDDAIVIYDNMYTTQGVKGIPDLLR